MLICFDIGASRIKAALATGPGVLRPLGERPTPREDQAAFLQAMADLAGPVRGGLRGVSIAIAGVADPADWRLRIANIPCLDGQNLIALTEAKLGLRTVLANDADCFALAEAQTGAGRGHRNVFGIILGTGIGGGLVLDGKIVRGAGGFAGEWGHGPVLHQGMRVQGIEVPVHRCGCGLMGCLDMFGARGLERLHVELGGAAAEAPEILAGWVQGDLAAERTVDLWLEVLAGPLAMVLNVTGASIVPAGGGLAKVTELVAALDRLVQARVLRRSGAALVVPAQHALEPGLIGASVLGFQEPDFG